MLETYLAVGEICFGGKARVFLRALDAGDGLLVSKWRNTPEARASFFSPAVVTPDSHARWLAAKGPYDLVWMACHVDDIATVGMAGLRIDLANYAGEYGRLVISPLYRGQGYAQEISYTVLAVAFELFELRLLWLEAFTGNAAALSLYDKIGFQRAGVDVEGHTHPRGPVQYMTMDRARWAAIRPRFYEMVGQEAPEWTP